MGIMNKQQLELGIRMLERDAYEKQDTLEQLQKQLEDTRSINQRLFDEVREKNDKERERLRKLEESKQAISALRSENENIFTEHEKLKIQVCVSVVSISLLSLFLLRKPTHLI